MTHNILCCDGGGIRGLITALLIQNLHDTFPGFIDKAKGFAGTSTGGLIALGLAREKPIDEIVEIYKTKGAEIFTPNGVFAETADQVEPNGEDEELMAGPGMLSCQYKSDGLKALAEELLGDHQLRDSEKAVIVNAAQLWDGYTLSWRSCTLSSLPDNRFRNVSMVDAALATSAAPTYFPPHQISDELGYFVDGGLFANNPAMTAVSEVIGGGLVDGLSDVRVLSLGTGHDPQGIPPSLFQKHKPLSWGAKNWLWPWKWGEHVPSMALVSLMFDATATSATAEAEKLLGEAFCRGNVSLDAPYALDDYEHVAELEERTTEYMKTEAWREVCGWVEENWK